MRTVDYIISLAGIFTVIFIMMVSCVGTDFESEGSKGRRLYGDYKFRVKEFPKAPKSYFQEHWIYCDSMQQIGPKEIEVWVDGIKIRKLTNGEFVIVSNPYYSSKED